MDFLLSFKQAKNGIVIFLACLEVRIGECGPQFDTTLQIEVRIHECGPQFDTILQIQVRIRQCGPQFAI